MRAEVIREFGLPSVFQEATLHKPTVQPGHVLIQVKATSVNQIDCKIRSGAVKAIAPKFPAVLGGDVAGVIAEVGPGVTEFREGDEVYGCAGGVKGTGGALAEYMLADVHCIAHKPSSLSFLQAAALPLVTITAWTALFLRAYIQPHHAVLIHGGAGGVGHIALQLARAAGVSPVATVGSDEDAEIARRFGAKETIHFRTETVPAYVERLTNGRGFDIIFDTVGGKNLENSFQAAALNGVISTTVARSTSDLTPLHDKGLSLHVVFMLIPLIYNIDRPYYGEILRKTAVLANEGMIVPLIDPHTFHISQIAQAHEHLESGKAKGKIVLAW